MTDTECPVCKARKAQTAARVRACRERQKIKAAQPKAMTGRKLRKALSDSLDQVAEIKEAIAEPAPKAALRVVDETPAKGPLSTIQGRPSPKPTKTTKGGKR